MSFWGELKRRNVYKVGAAYLVGAWLAAQALDIVVQIFEAPLWVGRLGLVLLLIGFPVTLIVAWAFEIAPEEVRRTAGVAVAGSARALSGRKLNYLIIGLLSIAVVFLVVDNYVLDGRAPSAAAATQAASPAAPGRLDNSVAVLPFENLSPDANNAYFAAGIHEEVLNRLAKLGNVSVISRTSVMRYADTKLSIPEIARELNVETVMEGSVRYAGDRVLVTVQLIDAGKDQPRWSDQYERPFADIFAIQADIAMNIANALQAKFTPAEQRDIEKRPTESLEAYRHYLAGLAAARTENFRLALESFDAALALDPSFVDAWIGKAWQLGYRIAFFDGGFADQKQQIVDAATHAIRIAPDDGRGYVALGFALGQQGKWLRAEDEFRRAIALGVKPGDMGQHFLLQMAVGNFEGARDTIEAELRVDPLAQGQAGFLLAAYEALGNSSARRAAYERGEKTFGNWWGDTVEVMLRQGDHDVEFLRAMKFGHPVVDLGQSKLDTPQEALAALKERYSSGQLRRTPANLSLMANWAAYFGDPQFALELMRATIKEQLEVTIWYLWLPLYDDVRRLPEFKDLVRDLGLPEYWRAYGWPKYCRPLGADDFECS